jgi:hypothetical protein
VRINFFSPTFIFFLVVDVTNLFDGTYRPSIRFHISVPSLNVPPRSDTPFLFLLNFPNFTKHERNTIPLNLPFLPLLRPTPLPRLQRMRPQIQTPLGIRE